MTTTTTQFKPVKRGTKTKGQLKAIWGLAKTDGSDDENLHALVQRETGKKSIANLSRAEADKVITALGGQAQTPARGNSIRNRQYKARKAGVIKLASPAQHALLKSLAKTRWAELADEALAKFCRGQIAKPVPHTSAEASRLITTLKKMNEREAANG